MLDVYDDDATLRDARGRYFEVNGFGADGGYGLAWVSVKVGPIPTRIPNTKGRVRAVRFHDLHHVVTGYRTNFRGECEIGAWEVASGCADHWAAWVLNLYAFAGGLLFAPHDVWRAFVRGRSTRNLYRATFDDALLARRVGEVRAELGLDHPPRPARAADATAFIGWSLVGLSMLSSAAVMSPVSAIVIALLSGWGKSAVQSHRAP